MVSAVYMRYFRDVFSDWDVFRRVRKIAKSKY